MRVLLIAPNAEERDFLSFALRHEGLQVSSFAAVTDAFPAPPERTSDSIVLCGRTGELLAAVQTIRQKTTAPLMLICDRLCEDQHCDYLDAGVDTVLQRPLALRLFIRYMKQLLRRSGSSPNTILTPIVTDEISLNPADRSVTVNGHPPVRLTQLEFRLLYILMTNAGQVIPTEEIVERVWGYGGEGSSDLVRGLVRRLRRKVEYDTKQPQFIHNIAGVGYRFLVGDEPAKIAKKPAKAA
ncbi:MAG TPA: response regulator transcription factor [Anaerolineae bacterium]|nr:response regulator transcription factor [Anaerolineae bacterium]